MCLPGWDTGPVMARLIGWSVTALPWLLGLLAILLLGGVFVYNGDLPTQISSGLAGIAFLVLFIRELRSRPNRSG